MGVKGRGGDGGGGRGEVQHICMFGENSGISSGNMVQTSHFPTF